MPLPFNDPTGNYFDTALIGESEYKSKLIKLHKEIEDFKRDHGQRVFLEVLDNLAFKTLQVFERTETYTQNVEDRQRPQFI